ncbi:RNA polymerase sigma factor [Gemmata sp.]|uniref:RNA polymerase sigma factor n=1 Tax=Gemmata sp. TaxID=1914242 RepID=UPI003F71530E
MGDADHEQELGWVRRARAGDRAAFAVLVDRYWDPVRRWLAGLSGQAHAAEDLAQETFLKAWTGLPRLAAPETFRVWLFRIARNEHLALLRSPRSAAGAPPVDAPDPAPGPPERTEEREAGAALRAAVEKLPEAYRAAYLLWTHEELPYAEIARVLDVTEETARWRVCDARRRLAVAMKRYLGDERR